MDLDELRCDCDWCSGCSQCSRLMERAANEIERLREERRQIQNALVAAEGDDLVAVIKGAGILMAELRAERDEARDVAMLWYRRWIKRTTASIEVLKTYPWLNGLEEDE